MHANDAAAKTVVVDPRYVFESLRRVFSALNIHDVRIQAGICGTQDRAMVEFPIPADAQPNGDAAPELPAQPVKALAGPEAPNRRPPRPEKGCVGDILTILCEVGHNLTGEEIFDQMRRRGLRWAESKVKYTLTAMVEMGRLGNDQHGNPRGYYVTYEDGCDGSAEMS